MQEGLITKYLIWSQIGTMSIDYKTEYKKKRNMNHLKVRTLPRCEPNR